MQNSQLYAQPLVDLSLHKQVFTELAPAAAADPGAARTTGGRWWEEEARESVFSKKIK